MRQTLEDLEHATQLASWTAEVGQLYHTLLDTLYALDVSLVTLQTQYSEDGSTVAPG